MTARLTAVLEKELGLAPGRVYVRYAQTPYWGWDGGNFSPCSRRDAARPDRYRKEIISLFGLY